VLGLLLFDAARRPRPSGPMTGVRIWDDGPARQAAPEPAPAFAATPAPTAIGGSWSERGALQAPMAGLPDGIPRQLMGGEVEAIWEIAANPERQLMGLLLCGMSETELAALRADDFDLEGGTVSVPGDGRSLALPPLLTLELSQSGALPAWGSAAEAEDLGHRITLLAHDVGIAHADEVTPAVLRHTYLTYLVRQGARLTELDRIAGAMDTATIRRYAPLSPAGASRPLEQLDLTYPLFG
jgi:succinoglycan biosynthesis transport protein ExoP